MINDQIYKEYKHYLFNKKKLNRVFTIVILLLAICLSMFNKMEIKAVEACTTDFTVDVVVSNTSFTQKGCFKTYAEAKTFFDTERTKTEHLVIRDRREKSQSKIIDMDYGYAVTSVHPLSYIFRSNSLSGTNNADATYVENHSKMFFHGSEINASGQLVYKVSVSGYTGYVHPNQVTLVPWKLVLDKLPFILKDNTSVSVTLPEQYVVQSDSAGNREMYYLSGLIGQYKIGPYGLAPTWLPNGTYYSIDGITFYRDFKMTDRVSNNKYYNYFQYLPLRTRSNITGAQLDQYLESTGWTNSIYYGKSQEFVNNQNKYGMNALLVFALANHESAFGTSTIALAKNNIFGWGAIDSDPMGGADAFTSVEHSIREHMSRNLFGYSSIDDWRFTSPAYGIKVSGFNTKYASDPNWGVKIAQHAYLVDKMFGYKDYNYYGLGVVDDLSNINVRAQGVLGAAVHYMIPGANLGLVNQTIAVTRPVGEYYESTSWYPIINGKILDHTNQGYYLNNIDTSLGYVHKDYVNLLNDSKWQPLPKGVLPTSQLLEIPPPPPVPEPEPEPEPVPEEEHNYFVNTGDGTNLNVRSTPSTSGTILGKLADKSTFYGVPESDGLWIKLTYNGKVGYVSAEYTAPYSPDVSVDIVTATGYKLVNTSLTGMNLTTTIQSIEDKVKSTVTVTKSDGTIKAKSDYVMTGDKLTVGGNTYTIAVKGDLNGDGNISITDYRMIKQHLLGVKPISGNVNVAADINSDGSLTIGDYRLIKQNLLNVSLIHR